MKRLSARFLTLGLVVCSVPVNAYAAVRTPVVYVSETGQEGNGNVTAADTVLEGAAGEAAGNHTEENAGQNIGEDMGEDQEKIGPLQQIREFLKVYYDFEGLESDTDQIPNLASEEENDALDGILHEESLRVTEEELAGGALKFTENTSEYLQIPESIELSQSYTVGLWVKFEETQMDLGRSNDLILVQPKAADSENGRTHLMVTADNKLATYMDHTTRAAETALEGFDRWQHVLISYDSEAKKVFLYANGQLVYESDITEDNVITEVTDLFIGRHKTAGEGSFQGYMDEIAVYNTALNAEQVTALYQEKANRRIWPDLEAMIVEAEGLLETDTLGAEAKESRDLEQALGLIAEAGISKDSSYTEINTCMISMASSLEAYKTAVTESQDPAPADSEVLTAPSDLQAQAGDGEVIVSWAETVGISKYKVQKNGDTTWTEVTGGSYKFTGLTNGTTYTFSVKAVKDGQESGAATITGKPEAAVQPGDPVKARAAAPVFSLQSGTLDQAAEITISSATEGAEIYYTVNGSAPSAANVSKKAQSIKYTPDSGIKVADSMVIKAVAVKESLESSEVVTVKYDMAKDWIFEDIKPTDGWRYTSLNYTYSTGVMSENGTGSGRFDGERKLTRGMFATVLYRMAGEPAAAAVSGFQDVKKDKYYAPAISWAFENGIVSGRPDGSFDPEGNITRAEIAKMLKGYADYCGFDTTAVKDLSAFADGAALIKKADWKKDALQWATAVNMITGKTMDSKSYLAADDNATRSECAQMISKFAKEYVK